MDYKGITVDGVLYENVHLLKLDRTGEVLDSDKTKRALSTRIKRVILGKFVNYTATFDADEASKEEYDRLFDVLSAPVESHVVKMPYGQRVIEYEAYVSKVSDSLRKIDEDGASWGSMQMQFIAVEKMNEE